MINLADHIDGFEAEVYLPYGLKWLYLDDPDRQEMMEPVELDETDPEKVVTEARELARRIMPDDADGFVVELGGIGLYDERRVQSA